MRTQLDPIAATPRPAELLEGTKKVAASVLVADCNTSSFAEGEGVPIPTFPEDVIVVKAPVVGVVAPTVPLILIEAVPVRFVTVHEEGVPKAPLGAT